MHRYVGWACVVAILLWSSHATAAKRKLLVMEPQIEGGVADNVARLLNELLLTAFQRSNFGDVTGGTDLQAMITNEQQKLLSGCSDVACLVEIAGALDTDFLAITSIGRIGRRFILNLKIINTRYGQSRRCRSGRH